MNKTIIAERFSKAISTYPREANVQRQIANKMIRLLQKHIPSPCPKVIEFGCGTGIYSRMLLRTLRPEELLLNDLCPEMRYCCEDLLREKQVSFLSGDAETISFPDKSTLITVPLCNGSTRRRSSSKGVIHCFTVRDTLLSVLLGKRI